MIDANIRDNPGQWNPKGTVEENLARGLFAIAEAIRYAARELGNGGAATSMGALEAHAVGKAASWPAVAAFKLSEGLDGVVGALDGLADAVADAARKR